MDIHQLKTFIVVAREGSVTRASELLHLSQPAVSAHIKALEDALGLALFERKSRGMSLTGDGQRLLVKAEQTLAAHRELMDEATRIKGRLVGKLRLGAAGSSSGHVGRLITILSERCPEVEVALEHGASRAVIAGIRSGSLDAGFYNEAGGPDPELATIELSRFGIFVVAPAGLVVTTEPLDWRALAGLPWIYPTSSACCGQAAEGLFELHRIRPKRIISVDREDVTRTLIAGGTGVGLLHAETARAAEARGEVEILFESPTVVRASFGCLASRAQDPMVAAAASIVREGAEPLTAERR